MRRKKPHEDSPDIEENTRWMMERTQIRGTIGVDKLGKSEQKTGSGGREEAKESLKGPEGATKDKQKPRELEEAYKKFNECTIQEGERYKDFVVRFQETWEAMRPEDRQLGIGKDRLLALKIKAAAKLGPRTLIATKEMADQEGGSTFEATKRAIVEIFRDRAYWSISKGEATITNGRGEIKGDTPRTAEEEETNPSEETQEMREWIRQSKGQIEDEPNRTPGIQPVGGERRTETDENQNPNTTEGAIGAGDEREHF